MVALLNSGRLTAPPWRILAALSGDATTAGNSGSTKPRMKKKLVQRVAGLGLFQLFQAVRFFDREFADRRTFERRKMPARPQLLS